VRAARAPRCWSGPAVGPTCRRGRPHRTAPPGPGGSTPWRGRWRPTGRGTRSAVALHRRGGIVPGRAHGHGQRAGPDVTVVGGKADPVLGAVCSDRGCGVGPDQQEAGQPRSSEPVDVASLRGPPQDGDGHGHLVVVMEIGRKEARRLRGRRHRARPCGCA
jgi:hypothetical protein